MSRIKVDALQGTSGSDTAITLSGANATVGGTLAVTGVHTIGNNAIYTSDGTAVTQNTVQSLVKCWVKNNQGANDLDSFNISSITDNGTGDYTETLTNAFSSTNFSYNGTCNNFSYNTIFLQSVATNSARLTLQGVLGGSNRDGVVGSKYCGALA